MITLRIMQSKLPIYRCSTTMTSIKCYPTHSIDNLQLKWNATTVQQRLAHHLFMELLWVNPVAGLTATSSSITNQAGK